MTDFIKQRSFELSYALFQLARRMKQKDLKGRVEANAVYLLESSEGADAVSLLKVITVLKKLILLGEGVGEISYDHSKLINGQFANLNAAIADYQAIRQSSEEKDSAIDIGKIFNNNSLLGNLSQSNVAKRQDSQKIVNRKLNDVTTLRTPLNQVRNTSSRQDAIVEKIRQSGNGFGCQLKDIIAAFPDVSERTLRYDLQRACEQGVVERVGNGGPTSYYRAKQSVQALVPVNAVTN